MKKLLPLLFLVTIGLGVGVIFAQTTYERGTVFISEVGGGNITFALNISAVNFSNLVGNQARFTTVNMLANGTYTRLGFGNDNANNTMNVTNLGLNYIAFDAIIENNTILEVYLPDDGEPDIIVGGIADNWIDPTLFITMNVDDTIILEWAAAPAPGGGNVLVNALNIFISIWPLIVILAFFGGKEFGLLDNPAFIFAFVVAIFGAIISIAIRVGWI